MTEVEQQGADAAENSFDERLVRLERIVRELEDGGLALEPAIEHYKEGVALLKNCRAILGDYRRQVEELTRDADAPVPYAGDPDQANGS